MFQALDLELLFAPSTKRSVFIRGFVLDHNVRAEISLQRFVNLEKLSIKDTYILVRNLKTQTFQGFLKTLVLLFSVKICTITIYRLLLFRR